MAYETVIYEKEGNVAIMTLNRPEVKNAFDRTMMTEMDLVLTEVARDVDARAAALPLLWPVISGWRLITPAST